MEYSTFEHIEKHIGTITRGWPSNAIDGFSVCLVERSPEVSVNTYVTLGVSNHVLNQPSRRSIRQEYLLVADISFPAGPLVDLLGTIATLAIGRHEAIVRGQVIHARATLAQVCSKVSLYATSATLFSNDATTIATSPPTVFTWLIPITLAEEKFRQTRGWSAFEDLLEQAEPDLFDLNRASTILPDGPGLNS